MNSLRFKLRLIMSKMEKKQKTIWIIIWQTTRVSKTCWMAMLLFLGAALILVRQYGQNVSSNLIIRSKQIPHMVCPLRCVKFKYYDIASRYNLFILKIYHGWKRKINIFDFCTSLVSLDFAKDRDTHDTQGSWLLRWVQPSLFWRGKFSG